MKIRHRGLCRVWFFIAAVAAAGASACLAADTESAGSPNGVIPVIFDTDIGDDIDDTWARSPDVAERAAAFGRSPRRLARPPRGDQRQEPLAHNRRRAALGGLSRRKPLASRQHQSETGLRLVCRVAIAK